MAKSASLLRSSAPRRVSRKRTRHCRRQTGARHLRGRAFRPRRSSAVRRPSCRRASTAPRRTDCRSDPMRIRAGADMHACVQRRDDRRHPPHRLAGMRHDTIAAETQRVLHRPADAKRLHAQRRDQRIRCREARWTSEAARSAFACSPRRRDRASCGSGPVLRPVDSDRKPRTCRPPAGSRGIFPWRQHRGPCCCGMPAVIRSTIPLNREACRLRSQSAEIDGNELRLRVLESQRQTRGRTELADPTRKCFFTPKFLQCASWPG